MRVVVTGGAGFIGGNVCRHLAGRGHDVVVLDDLSTGDKANLLALPVTFVEGSILDRDALDETFDGAGAVLHLAARPSVPRSVAEPVTAHVVNATGTIEVLEAARRAGDVHTVVASSSSVYGANPAMPKREDLLPMPMSPYAASKLAAESYALAHGSVYGLPVLALRFFNVFGPLQPPRHAYASVVPAFVDAARAGRPLPVHGDGTQSRDFTFVDSVAEVLVDAAERRVTSDRPVNLAFGSRVSVLELADALGRVLGRELPLCFGPARVADMPHTQADQTRLRALFPDARPVPLEEGLRRTVDWFATLA